MKRLYHITAPKNVHSILRDGLRANKDGEIFLFEDKAIKNKINNTVIFVADHIALNQINQRKYAMLLIDCKGIDVELIPDNVGEVTAHLQWIAKQPIVKPDYIKFCGFCIAEGWHTEND